MRSILRFISFFITSILLLVSCQQKEDKEKTILCITEDAIDITPNNATLKGSVKADGEGGVSADVWFLYSSSENELERLKSFGEKLEATINNDGSFSCSLSSLHFNTTYFFVACASVLDREYYGEVKSFSSKDFSVSVTTEDATDIVVSGLFSATLQGSMTLDSEEDLSVNVEFRYTDFECDYDVLKSYGNKLQSTLNNDGSFSYKLEQLNYNVTYYYVAYAKVLDREYYGEVKSFTTGDFSYDKIEAVDMGLSVKWANVNLGASTPEEYGAHFAWGDVAPTHDTWWSNYKWCEGSKSTLTKYNNNSGYGSVDNRTELEACDDAAQVILVGDWRMPTDDEMTELRSNCNWAWTSLNGVKGYQVTSNVNGASIFIPAAGMQNGDSIGNDYGYYWSSSLYASDSRKAWYLSFNSENVNRDNYLYRCYGLSVRPVSKIPLFYVHNDKFSVSGSATSATLFVLGNVDWTASCLNATVNPSSGSGRGNVIVSFEPNNDTVNDKTYIVNLSTNEEVDNQVIAVTITQKAALAEGEQEEVIVDFTDMCFSNAQDITCVEQDGLVIDFEKVKNQTPARYYDNSNTVRVYGGNTMKVTGGTIKEIEITFNPAYTNSTNTLMVDNGQWENPLWTGDNSSVTFTVSGTSGYLGIQKLRVVKSN